MEHHVIFIEKYDAPCKTYNMTFVMNFDPLILTLRNTKLAAVTYEKIGLFSHSLIFDIGMSLTITSLGRARVLQNVPVGVCEYFLL